MVCVFVPERACVCVCMYEWMYNDKIKYRYKIKEGRKFNEGDGVQLGTQLRLHKTKWSVNKKKDKVYIIRD